jgi:ABC-2 type transport system permease protein
LVLSESISNASFGIYLPRWSGTIYELLSAPVSFVEVVLGYVRARQGRRRLVASGAGMSLCRPQQVAPVVTIVR